MHCRSCELLIEDELTKIQGVKSVKTDYQTGQTTIEHAGPIDKNLIASAVKRAGYVLGTSQVKPLWISRSARMWGQVGLVGAILVLLYLVSIRSGLALPQINTLSGQAITWTALLVGLTAGVSTCMALVGGLVAGLMGKYQSSHPDAPWRQKLKPLLTFLLGRLVGFAFLGGLMGTLGSVVSISMTSTAILTVVVAVVMLFLGLQLLGIFPRLSQMSLSLPTGLARSLKLPGRAKNQYDTISTLVLGVLTFFVPCGFTQAMQLVALGSGSFMTGASIMFLFALGTAPGLLGIGSVAGLIRLKKNNLLFVTVGLILIAFAIFNLKVGLNTLGLRIPSTDTTASINTTGFRPEIIAGQQIIRMTQELDGYSPDTLVISRKWPVKWIVTSVNPYSCASSLAVPDLGVSRFLKQGENIIEFTPPASGDKIDFSCSMGMYSGQILIVDD